MLRVESELLGSRKPPLYMDDAPVTVLLVEDEPTEAFGLLLGTGRKPLISA
jgi:hypothetical protein